jgi:hypothetical protein
MQMAPPIPIRELWHSDDPKAWEDALGRYWDFVQPGNMELERALEQLDLDRIRGMDARGWYKFLYDEYFPWKYTAKNYLAAQRKQLRRYEEEGHLESLNLIREGLLTIDRSDVRLALSMALEILGLGPAGASGLLALMYPAEFGTVDQFAVMALCGVGDLPEHSLLSRMKPKNLTIKNGVLLIGIMRQKAVDNNRLFGTDTWTPRKIDKVLWTYGRPVKS